MLMLGICLCLLRTCFLHFWSTLGSGGRIHGCAKVYWNQHDTASPVYYCKVLSLLRLQLSCQYFGVQLFFLYLSCFCSIVFLSKCFLLFNVCSNSICLSVRINTMLLFFFFFTTSIKFQE